MRRNNTDILAALTFLKSNSRLLTVQQYRTIKGQIIVGDINGALKGINTIINRKAGSGH